MVWLWVILALIAAVVGIVWLVLRKKSKVTTSSPSPSAASEVSFSDQYKAKLEASRLRRIKEDQDAAREAKIGSSMGVESDRLFAELLTVGRQEGFLSQEQDARFYEGRNIRARWIGTRLHELGGKSLMLVAYHEVKLVSGQQAAHLEAAWDGIGEWVS